MGTKIIISMKTEDPLNPEEIILGGAELSSDTAGFGLVQVPDILRMIAEGLESAMTTGPDAGTWLQEGPSDGCVDLRALLGKSDQCRVPLVGEG